MFVGRMARANSPNNFCEWNKFTFCLDVAQPSDMLIDDKFSVQPPGFCHLTYENFSGVQPAQQNLVSGFVERASQKKLSLSFLANS